MRSTRNQACRHGVGKRHSPILRSGKCRSRPQKAHAQLGVRRRPSSPNGSLGDDERQQRESSSERAHHLTWCCGRPKVGLGSKERVKSSFFEPDGGRPDSSCARRGAMDFFGRYSQRDDVACMTSQPSRLPVMLISRRRKLSLKITFWFVMISFVRGLENGAHNFHTLIWNM